MMGRKYSFEARLELARRSSAIFQRSALNWSILEKWSAVILFIVSLIRARAVRPTAEPAKQAGATSTMKSRVHVRMWAQDVCLRGKPLLTHWQTLVKHAIHMDK